MTNLLLTTLAFRLVAQQMMDIKATDVDVAALGKAIGKWRLPKAQAGHELSARTVGKVLTTNYHFTFTAPYFAAPPRHSTACMARLVLIDRTDYLGSREIDLIRRVANTPSRIGTNEALQLATQWLSTLSVDVAALQRISGPAEVKQMEIGEKWLDPAVDANDPDVIFGDRRPTGMRWLPIYTVVWGAGDLDAHVVILGTTRELLTLSVRNTSVFTNQPMVITNFMELLSKRDPPSQK